MGAVTQFQLKMGLTRQELARKLAKDVDIMLENFKPGTTEKGRYSVMSKRRYLIPVEFFKSRVIA